MLNPHRQLCKYGPHLCTLKRNFRAQYLFKKFALLLKSTQSNISSMTVPWLRFDRQFMVKVVGAILSFFSVCGDILGSFHYLCAGGRLLPLTAVCKWYDHEDREDPLLTHFIFILGNVVHIEGNVWGVSLKLPWFPHHTCFPCNFFFQNSKVHFWAIRKICAHCDCVVKNFRRSNLKASKPWQTQLDRQRHRHYCHKWVKDCPEKCENWYCNRLCTQH